MKNSREAMLERIRSNKPEPSPLPNIPSFDAPKGQLTDLFTETLAGVGGSVIDLPAEDLKAYITELYPDAQHRWSGLPEYLESTITLGKDPHELEILELALVQGAFGVAENAAIWVEESALPHRALAFITQHLILVLNKQDIVWNMHQAYAKLNGSLPGFGLFISGPSKTADIEQSLVIGAQGPRSLSVILL